MNPVAKRMFQGASFLTVIVSLFCMHLLMQRGVGLFSHAFSHWTRIWAGAALAGTVCAYLGGGGPSKRPTEALELLAMALNLTCLAALVILLLISSVHD